MKPLKLLTILLVSLCAFACSKASVTPEKDVYSAVQVTFDYALVESNSMYTKAIANEDVVFAIRQCLPQSVTLLLRNSQGSVVTVQTGVEVSLPEGSYSVTGSYNSASLGDFVNNSSHFTANPYITFDTRVEIVKGTSSYTVTGTYRSFAIVIDYDETASATYTALSSQEVSVPFQRFDNIGVVFANGSFSDTPLKMTLTPLNTVTHQETTFSFSTNSNTTKYTYVEPGKFYKLHPKDKATSDPVVEVGFPDFSEGAVKNP